VLGSVSGVYGSSWQSWDWVGAVVNDAYYERVATLLVASGMQQWGTFDPQSQAVTLHNERQSGDQDLLDLAAVHTFLNRGKVYVVSPEEMPAGKPVAAIFRY